MKRIILVIIFCFFIFSLISAQVVNGDTLSVDGKKILKVWGTHYERGYATGYIMGNNIMSLLQNYFIASLFNSSPSLYQMIRSFFLTNVSIEDKYNQEAQGMIDGMIASGNSLYSPTLQRDLDKDDILMVNSVVDMASFTELQDKLCLGCSSLSSWGENTLDDPDLNGTLVLTRQLDWSSTAELYDNHLLVVHFPAENDEVNWISFTFPGLFGTLSGINEDGVCAFMNMGNIHTYTATNNLHPLLLSVRNGIESYDYNEDFVMNGLDVADAIADKLHLAGSIVHAATQESGLIVETNNSGSMVRYDSDNTVVPSDCLVATNHFRVLSNPVNCYRYANIADSLAANSNMTVERSWNVLKGASSVSTNMQMIEYIPACNLVNWSTADPTHPAYMNVPTTFELSELFTMPVSIDNQYAKVIQVVNTYPNPFVDTASLSFSLSQSCSVSLSIFNVRGQKLKSLVDESRSRGSYTVLWDGRDESGQTLPSGIYFYRFSTDYMMETGRLVLVK
ncbi:MAG TPA: FlgD immunoglobulin-like domain containing protein [Candidatus Cloacimonadota bacterium]|nr:FlgD immunoglobulin-like domain containing protein [Candidatus Cloacimonadota bacterium]